MNRKTISQVILIGLWVLLLAGPAFAGNILNILDDHLRCRRANLDMWCVEQSDWRSLSSDDNTLAASLQVYALHGINTIGLQDHGDKVSFRNIRIKLLD